jgi:glucoamylase
MQWGQGRGWPLLTGERGHYELAAGHDCRPFLHAMEQFSNGTCLLPEQIWDEADIPEAHPRRGGPTGSANPLLWAHSEYLRLLRSSHDGKVFDQIPEIVAVSRWRGGQQSGVLAAKASDSTSNEGAHASHLCG